MLLVYVDESYCNACYFVTALLCPERQALPLASALDTVVRHAADSYGVDAGAELHGYDIFQARGQWAAMASQVRARIGVYGKAFAAIADEPGQADQQPEYRGNLERFRRNGTAGYRSRRLSRIVDTLHFAPSSASWLLQAVDMVAFLHHRMQTSDLAHDQRAVRANDTLWRRIEPRVVHCHCWSPNPGRTRALP